MDLLLRIPGKSEPTCFGTLSCTMKRNEKASNNGEEKTGTFFQRLSFLPGIHCSEWTQKVPTIHRMEQGTRQHVSDTCVTIFRELFSNKVLWHAQKLKNSRSQDLYFLESSCSPHGHILFNVSCKTGYPGISSGIVSEKFCNPLLVCPKWDSAIKTKKCKFECKMIWSPICARVTEEGGMPGRGCHMHSFLFNQSPDLTSAAAEELEKSEMKCPVFLFRVKTARHTSKKQETVTATSSTQAKCSIRGFFFNSDCAAKNRQNRCFVLDS